MAVSTVLSGLQTSN